MSCEELCLHSELANIDFTQFNVMVVGRVAAEGLNLANRLGSPFYTPMLSPPTTPHPPLLLLPPVILSVRKSCPKQGIFSVSETYTPTK